MEASPDPLPVEKAYELGAKKIILIRTYEKNLEGS